MTLGSLQQAWPREPTENQMMHLARIAEACELLRLYLHEAEGSAMPGEHQEHVFMGRRMRAAAMHLETAEMFARKAALE
jgi:hypothetical protein